MLRVESEIKAVQQLAAVEAEEEQQQEEAEVEEVVVMVAVAVEVAAITMANPARKASGIRT